MAVPSKRPTPSPAFKPLPFYDNEDWYTWVKVADEPDSALAGQRLANSTGLVYAFDGRTAALLTDCGEAEECTGVCAASMYDCWVFVGGWDTKTDAAEIAEYAKEHPDVTIHKTTYA